MNTLGGATNNRVSRGLRVLLVGALAASALTGLQIVTEPAPPAEAADLSQFRAGNIIADQLFFDPNAMNAAQVQAFLNARVPSCPSSSQCLKNYTQTTFTIPATPMCSTYQGAANETAATIIYKVAQACGVSAKVILVMLQKEQSLVTSTAPSARNYRSAMGAGCPDTADCDTNYYGFFQQVHYGTYLLKRYTHPPGTGPGTEYTSRFDLMYPVGRTSQILFHPNGACGTTPVFVENQATHSLYVYTPYTPNQAALNAGYSVGDSCSSYGNRNFFNFYTDWFGSTQVPPLVNLSGSPTALGVPQVGQLLSGYAGMISPSPDSISCTWQRAGAAIGGANNCVYQVTPDDIGQQLAVTVTITKSGYQTLIQTSAPTIAVTLPPAAYDGLNALLPARLADTRAGQRTIDGVVQGVGAIGPGQTLRIPILGRAGIPATGVGAVTLNVTATSPTAPSYLTVFPTGQPRPLASNLNFTPGQTIPNSVIAQIGTDGSISIYNNDGNTHVIVDISGWFPDTGVFTSVSPARLADTRAGQRTIDGVVQGVGAIGPGQTLRIPILGRAGIPATGVGAVTLNVTATSPTAPSYLTVFPTGQPRPLASNLNFTPGQTIPNSVIAQIGTDGSISIYNNDGNTHVIVDISGWFPDTGVFTSVSPARLADTRAGQRTIDGVVQGVGAIGPGQTLRIPILGRAGIPATGVGAVTLNVTATSPTAPSYLTVFPTGQPRPLASNLNFTPGQTIPNSVIAQIGTDGSISIYNNDGNTHVIVDISGWFPVDAP